MFIRKGGRQGEASAFVLGGQKAAFVFDKILLIYNTR